MLQINVQAIIAGNRILVTVPHNKVEDLVKALHRVTNDIVTWPDWKSFSAAISVIYDDMLLSENGAREAINAIASIIVQYMEAKNE